jgi:muramoyltetrapeptide carboxypeptidase
MFHRIKKGSTIGLIAPAWIPNKERLEKGIAYLQKSGFKIKLGKYIYEKHGYFAGSDQQRLSDLHRMYADPEVLAIICARGGWGSLRILDKIDYSLIRKNPKPLIGYSDITGLQLAIWSKCQIPSLSGPFVAVEMANGINPFTEKHFWGQLFNRESKYKFNFSDTSTNFLHPGNSSGILVGGCLSLITSLLGTSYCPNYENTILFIEEVGEKPYKIDRNLAQLKQAGIFNKINGLILGNFIDCDDSKTEHSFTVEEIFRDYFVKSNYPVIINFPYGHNGVMMSIPIGIRALIDGDKNEISFANPFSGIARYHKKN